MVWRDPERIRPSLDAAVRALETETLGHPPGAQFEYANMGYATLGSIIEAVSREPAALPRLREPGPPR